MNQGMENLELKPCTETPLAARSIIWGMFSRSSYTCATESRAQGPAATVSLHTEASTTGKVPYKSANDNAWGPNMLDQQNFRR